MMLRFKTGRLETINGPKGLITIARFAGGLPLVSDSNFHDPEQIKRATKSRLGGFSLETASGLDCQIFLRRVEKISGTEQNYTNRGFTFGYSGQIQGPIVIVTEISITCHEARVLQISPEDHLSAPIWEIKLTNSADNFELACSGTGVANGDHWKRDSITMQRTNGQSHCIVHLNAEIPFHNSDNGFRGELAAQKTIKTTDPRARQIAASFGVGRFDEIDLAKTIERIGEQVTGLGVPRLCDFLVFGEKNESRRSAEVGAEAGK